MSILINILLIVLLLILSQLPQIGLLIGTAMGYSLPLTVVVASVYIVTTLGFLIYGFKSGLLRKGKIWWSKKNLYYLPLGYIGLILASVLGQYLLTLVGETNSANQAAIEAMMGQIPKLIMFIQLVLLAPIAEEIICRGLVPKLFSDKYVLVGHLLGTVLFAFLHVPTNLPSFLTYFMMGGVIAFVRWHSDSLELAVNLHILNNLVSFLTLISLV